MQKHTAAGLTGIFTSLALLAANGAQAQTPDAPQAQSSQTLILTPLKGFDLKEADLRPFPDNSRYAPRSGERSAGRARDGIGLDLHIGSAANDRFSDRLRSGDIASGDLGRGTISIRAKKGLSIRYKLQF